ncbi:hypothetical protein N7493_008105 [Penicillium malachiteum]|uniref:Nucleoside phosphorylase domain-containing protein n=1 Tax=Penicillium malachiteum TaxID=1324776 RepID=A0AAD6HGM2_9EURO|nr:hypothetical protein N7493_008105 [Penicillium malachiteum]
MRPKSRNDFAIAIICALPIEVDAVEALFDETFDRFGRLYGRQPRDTNIYINGRIGKHNVVLCCMPGMGKGSAASVASTLRISYTEIQLALVVGICGGAPSPSLGRQIYLGDVLISDSVITYDFGRQYPGGFRIKTNVKDILGRPNQEIRSILTGLQISRSQVEFRDQMLLNLHGLQQKETKWQHPGFQDILFEASYLHKHHAEFSPNRCGCSIEDSPYDICDEALELKCHDLRCDKNQIIRQRSGTNNKASVHIGAIASADTVMKSAKHRDTITRDQGVFGFEMEAAGVWDNIHCIIVKGVCDYADSHKSKEWQHYAAATGASAAKAFLEYCHFGKDENSQCLSLGYPANDENAQKQRTARDNKSNPTLKSRSLPPSDFRSDNYESSAGDSETSTGEEMVLLPKSSKAPISSTDAWPTGRPKSIANSSGTSITPGIADNISEEFRRSFRYKAALLYHRGQWDDLAGHMDTLIEKLDPTDQDYSQSLGIMGLALLFCSGRETRAREFLRKAKQTSKENRQVGLNYLLARAYIRQNKNDQGFAHLRQASHDLLQESGSDQELIFEEGYNLGLILLKNPRTKPEGLELLKNVQEQCYRLHPQHPMGLKSFTALNTHRA